MLFLGLMWITFQDVTARFSREAREQLLPGLTVDALVCADDTMLLSGKASAMTELTVECDQ